MFANASFEDTRYIQSFLEGKRGNVWRLFQIFGHLWINLAHFFFFFLILIFSEMLRGAKQKYHELVSRTSEIEISRDLLNFEENYDATDRFKCFGKFKKPRVP